MATSPFTSGREARKADRRRTILEVAERHFLDRGFADTSMSTIASSLGGSKTTLWTYFPSKDALFYAVVDGKIEAFHAKLRTALNKSGDVRAALTRFARIFLDKTLEPQSITLRRLILSMADRFPEISREFTVRGPDRLRDLLRGYLEREIAEGRLRAGDPVVAARQFLGLCQSGCYSDRLWCPSMPGSSEPETDVANAVDTFLRAWGSL